MNRDARDTVLKTRHMLALRDLVEAVEWKTRAEMRVKEAELKLTKVLEDAMAPEQTSPAKET